MEAYIPLSMVGNGAIGCLPLLSGASKFHKHFVLSSEIKKNQTIHKKPLWGLFPHSRGRDGAIGCLLTKSGSFEFCEHFFSNNFSSKTQKLAKYTRNNYGASYFPPQDGQGWSN